MNGGPTDREPLTYGPFTRPTFQQVHNSLFDFDGTIECLKQAIAGEDLWLIQEIDPRDLVARAGITIAPTRQLLFFHPRLMRQVLTTCPDAIIEAPLKYVVMELDGGSVQVRHLDPIQQFGRYHRLDDLADELHTILQRIISRIITL